ncbi:MAG: TIGR03545 family protein [Brevinematales bacterium]|nr:TIGR03545 family protein [Brevinematales bacterium]
MAKEKKPKKAKIHKMFKIKYTQTHWERFLEKCYNDADREKLATFFEQDKKKRYVLRTNLTPEETQILADIGKRIELGYSFLQVWKLIAVGVIFVGISLFLALFQNKLLENALERVLSSVFQAKADIVGLRLDIPRLSFRFVSLSVGDEEEPYRNLFELGKTEVRLNPQALTLGRFVIENIQCEDIRWNTPRTTPGTLPSLNKRETTQEKNTKKESASSTNAPSFDLSQVTENLSQLVVAQRTNLKSEQTLQKANTELSNILDQWTKTYEQKNAQIAQLSPQAKELQNIQISSLKTVEDAQKVLAQIDSFNKNVMSMSGDIKTTAQQFKTTYEKALQHQKAIATALEEDKAYLQKLIALPVTDGKNILQGMVDDFLRKKLGKIYSYGKRAIAYAQNLKSDPSQKPKKQGYQRLKGRTIPYPSDPYPSFLLKNLQSSVETPERRFSGRLENVSSDPYKWTKPILFTYQQAEKVSSYGLKVSMDIRTNAPTVMLAELKGEGLPFRIDNLGFLRISNLAASLRLESAFQWDREKNTGKIKAVFSSIRLDNVDTTDFVTRIVAEILEQTKSFDVSVAYTMPNDGNIQLSLQSSLDTLLQKKIGEYLAKLTKEAREKIEKELNALLKSELEKNEILSKNLQGINEVSLKTLTDMNTYEKLVETKKREVQTRIEQIKKEQEEALKKKAQEALPNLPNVQIPKIGK